MQPILVRRLVDGEKRAGKYEIIAGERRFRASPAGWAGGSAGAGARGAQRGGCGHGADREHPARRPEPAGRSPGPAAPDPRVWPHARAGRAGRGSPAQRASNLLRLLNPAEPVQTMLMAGDIDMGHACHCWRCTAPRRSPRATRSRLKLSVREAESPVKKIGAEFNLVPQSPRRKVARHENA